MKGDGRNWRGFTLVEIAAVVGILALLMAIAIPNFMRARSNTYEVTALTSCQTIGKACQGFYSGTVPHSYPDDLATLSGTTPSYIDPLLGGGQKQGYRFDYRLVDAERFELRAEPVHPGHTGNRYYFLDQTGVLRVSQGAPAGPADRPVE